jgi:hypothetical protein
MRLRLEADRGIRYIGGMSNAPCSPSPLFRLRRLRGPAAAGLAVVLLAGCRAPEPAQTTRPPEPADTTAPQTVHAREFLFVGERAGVPLVVSFQFATVEQAPGLRRSVRAWLAQGPQWERFLDQAADSPSAAGGVWRIVPQGDLRVIAGGPHEVEALVFRSGERQLRLAPAILRATWAPREDLQYRLYEASVEVAAQPLRGSVLEAYRVLRGDPEFVVAGGAVDWLFLTDGRDIQLVLAESLDPQPSPEKTFAWVVRPEEERTWASAEVRWLEMMPVEAARRDAPVAWSLRVPEAGLSGEVHSVGWDLQLGPERPGRRALLLRHNVEGWIEVGGERVRIFGYLRHSQD